MIDTLLIIANYMAANPTDEFLAAKRFLKNKFEQHPGLDIINRTIKNLQPKSGWSLINELIQNAVDIKATEIKFTFTENRDLWFEHNADVNRYPLDAKSIQGLCGVAESTKGLNSVGFMGIGFKFFTKFFRSVSITDRKSYFKISFPSTGYWKDEISNLYSPEWVDVKENPSSNYTTSFYFQDIVPEEDSKIENVFGKITYEQFALFVKKGLKRVIFENLSNENGVTHDLIGTLENDAVVKITAGTNSKSYLVLEEIMTASDDAKQLVVNNRSFDLELQVAENAELKRTISMIVEVDVDGDISAPKPHIHNGKLFCLVPLKHKFPFKIGLDADWFMDNERSKLLFDPDSVKWHGEMINSTLPVLIKRYLDLLEPGLKGEKRQKATDIFPLSSATLENEFKFLSNENFKKSLVKELNSTKFILSTDGKIRSPPEVKNIEDLPGGEKKSWTGYVWQYAETLNQNIYRKFIDCIDAPVIDRFSVSKNTIDYLESELNLLNYPDISDFNEEKVRQLWDPANPSDYLHILDLLSSMFLSGNTSMNVVPINDGTWADLHDTNLVFEALPTETNERTLYQHLRTSDSRFDDLLEIHDELKLGIKTGNNAYSKDWGDASGNKWKETKFENGETFYGRTIKVGQEVSLIKDPDEHLVCSILNFALRTNNPHIVNYLMSNDGVSKSSDCLIPSPYANNNLISIENNRILSESIIDILDAIPKESNTKKFLIKAGLINVLPLEYHQISGDSKMVLDRTGIKVGGGLHRSSYASEGSSTKNAWTIIDWKWPINLDKFSPSSISVYFSEPSEELMQAMNKARKKCGMTYFYIKSRDWRGTKTTSWLKELMSTAWVKCSDDEFRTPSRSPIEGSDSTSSFFGILNEKEIEDYTRLGLKFESSLDDLSERECLEFWQDNQVRRSQLFLQKLKSLDESSAEKIAYALETLWPTSGELFENTKLKNFVKTPIANRGGYIGNTGVIDASITEYLEQIGFTFPENEHSELVCACISELNTMFKENKNPSIIVNLQSCWKRLAMQDFDIEKLTVINSKNEIVSLQDHIYYIHPFSDDRRFDLNEHSLLYKQFPPELSVLKRLSNNCNALEIIDAEIGSVPGENILTQDPNLSRIIRSMDLNIDLYLYDENHRWTFQSKNVDLYIVIKSESEPFKLFLKKGHKDEWVDDLYTFLLEQNRDLFMNAHKSLRELISNYEIDSNFFDPIYFAFCNDYGLKIFDSSTVQDPLKTQKPSILDEKAMKQSQPAKLRIAGQKKEIEPKGQKDKFENKKDESNDKSNDNKTVTTVERDHELDSNEKKINIFTDKQIGERAEYIVRRYLLKQGWAVTDSNNQIENHPGSDIRAQKGDIARIIEVKGTRGEWKSVAMNHQQGLHFFNTVKEDGGSGNLEYWFCVVENILNEEQTEISKKDPGLHTINLSREKPKHIFNMTQWSKRNRPDSDF